ncbi:sugar ABC transporter substrate-binding protein [Nostocoides sp. HKS02]|uniref:sugar ABC transporter substrate-binding protein n=1 Tax=Nostocoides sp. HKS02 TaxID=1813880 RepID=UPI0018A83BEF|nr:sugar ABC transporter substrate-binding protein [Tetrasphaera sp. HKS02]
MSTLRRRRTTSLSVLAIGSATALLAACASGTGSATTTSSSSSSSSSSTSAASGGALPKSLVFSPLSLAPPALQGLSKGVQGYAGSKGWQVVVQDPNFNPTKQTQDLSAVIDSGRVGAAWVLAIAPKGFGDMLKKAQSKGVPILVNGKPDEYGLSGPQPGITFDYIDYSQAGTAIGDQLGKCVNSKLGGKANVLFSTSAAGTAGKQEMEAAAKKALAAAAPQAKIVDEQIIVDRTKGVTTIASSLQGHPNLNAIMSTGDEGTLAAITAFQSAGKTLGCNVDFGGNDEVLGLVKSGKIFASVALQFQADMAQSFDTLVKMQADPKAVGQVLVVPQKIVTQNG